MITNATRKGETRCVFRFRCRKTIVSAWVLVRYMQWRFVTVSVLSSSEHSEFDQV